MEAPEHFDVLVIGSGFGGTITSLTIAREFKRRQKGERVHILERGTWWTTPVGTVTDPQVKIYQHLRKNEQPVQYWPSVNSFRGFIDIVLRCLQGKKNEDGLFDLTRFGRSGFLGLGSQNDGVSVMRANGVGGGSLIYSNVTIRPPDFVLDDPRWPNWPQAQRDADYEFARDAIGLGVLNALDTRDPAIPSASQTKPVNAGLSNIVTRSARLDPEWTVIADPLNPRRGTRQLTPVAPPPSTRLDPQNLLWIDRARVFQTHMAALTADFGTVDSSINDQAPEMNPLAGTAPEKPINYCERQGRCNVGCLPGARHTLNKQLMQAMFGKPDGTPPDLPGVLSIEALAEVDLVRAAPTGYQVEYKVRDPNKTWRYVRKVVTATRVIVAAGCIGTNELLLRSKAQAGLPHLSDRLGSRFSTNGDYLAFLLDTTDAVRLTRGPVTTSFAHFETPRAAGAAAARTEVFHTIEDQGVPAALASTVGFGLPLVRSLANGHGPRFLVIIAIVRFVWRRLVSTVVALFRNYRDRQDEFKSEDEYTDRMMCVAAMGREASIGQFRLGTKSGDTPLRLSRTDGKAFHEDPIYHEIRKSLDRFARRLTKEPNAQFINPFLTRAADALGAKSVTLSHALGGCPMAPDAARGVVDSEGRVFDKTKTGAAPYYGGLYVADAALIPAALGVNPSLTISALAIRVARAVISDVKAGLPTP